MARSISAASRTLTGMTSMPSGGAMAWITANWPIPEGFAGSRKTAARVTPGAICLSSSSHFPLKLYSNCMKPVVLPPGRARLSTRPLPTGSTAIANTIGIVRVACCNTAVEGVVVARMTSGASATNSAACLRCLSILLAAPQRMSIRTLRPSVQPNCCSPCKNASNRACPSESSLGEFMSTPMRRMRSPSCVRAASGHAAAAAPPRRVMKSRRASDQIPAGKGGQSFGRNTTRLRRTRLEYSCDALTAGRDLRFWAHGCRAAVPAYFRRWRKLTSRNSGWVKSTLAPFPTFVVWVKPAPRKYCGAACALHRVGGAGLLDGAPDPIGRGRHIQMTDAELGERIRNRIHHGGQRARPTRFAAAFDPEYVGCGRYGVMDDDDLRAIGGARKRIVHE